MGRLRGRGRTAGREWVPVGLVLPPHIREQMELTAEQEKQIAELEKEVKNRLEGRF